METIDNPLHDAAKRGNLSFLQECISNRVCVIVKATYLVTVLLRIMVFFLEIHDIY